MLISETITDEVLKSLANSSTCLAGLKHLDFTNCKNITDFGLSLIYNSNNCFNLEKIILDGTELSAQSILGICNS